MERNESLMPNDDNIFAPEIFFSKDEGRNVSHLNQTDAVIQLSDADVFALTKSETFVKEIDGIHQGAHQIKVSVEKEEPIEPTVYNTATGEREEHVGTNNQISFSGNEKGHSQQITEREKREDFDVHQDSLPIIDTTDCFTEIFSQKDRFKSWEDFITLFEEFQRLSCTVFKARSGTCVKYINEKRVTHKIPEKFVYQTVKMICVHFGSPTIKENSKRKFKKYVGLECEAFLKLSYKKGFLHITDMCLVHTNHPPEEEKMIETSIRKIRPVSYNNELDLTITQLVDQNKIFEGHQPELQRWQATLIQLQDADSRLQYLTQRMLKKRIQFLMDRYRVNSNGRLPLSNDNMGIILHRMIEAKKKRDSEEYIPRKPGRPRKRPGWVYKKAEQSGNPAESYKDYLHIKCTKIKNEGDDNKEQKEDSDHFSNFCLEDEEKPTLPAMVDTGMLSFLSYWTTRNEEENNLRLQEIAIRKEEIEVRMNEIELQKEKFEFEKSERQTLFDLLKKQEEVISDLSNSRTNEGFGKDTDYFVLSDGQLDQLAKTGAIGHL